MCGLIGVFSKAELSITELNAAKELFILTTTRGVDSTGLVYSDLSTNKYRIMKDQGNFFDLVGNDPETMKFLRANFLLGHCRWSTVGSSTKENAHPYTFSEFVGMHNGTLKDPKFLPTSVANQKTWKEKKTDSFLFFHELNNVLKKGGRIDDLVKTLKWDSAYAMILWDYLQTVTLFRNFDRPLYIGVEKTSGTVFVASEERFLKFIERSSIQFDIHKVKTHTLYQIDLNEVGNSKTPWTETEMTKPDIPATTVWTNQTGYYGASAWLDDPDSKWYFDKETGSYRERETHV